MSRPVFGRPKAGQWGVVFAGCGPGCRPVSARTEGERAHAQPRVATPRRSCRGRNGRAGHGRGTDSGSLGQRGTGGRAAGGRSLTAAGATRQRLASITSQVNGLLGKMTLAEKFGQLEMAGPSGANG